MKKIFVLFAVFFGFSSMAYAECDIIDDPKRIDSPAKDKLQQENHVAAPPCVGPGTIPQIIITGTLPIYNNGFLPIWTTSFPNYSEEIPGQGGSGGSFWWDDGTSGWADLDPTSRRMDPGCIAEQLFMTGLAIDITNSGGPVGTYIPLELGDPLYSDGTWRKYEVKNAIEHHTSDNYPGRNYVIKKRIKIHYMYNMVTRRVEQMKFKIVMRQVV